MEDPTKFAEVLVEGIKQKLPDIKDPEKGLMGLVNHLVNSVKEFPVLLGDLRKDVNKLMVTT